MTSENIEGVRAIGGHVVSPLTIFAVKSSCRFLTSTTSIILQQVTGEDVMTRSFADFTNFALGRRGCRMVGSRWRGKSVRVLGRLPL